MAEICDLVEISFIYDISRELFDGTINALVQNHSVKST